MLLRFLSTLTFNLAIDIAFDEIENKAKEISVTGSSFDFYKLP